MTATITAAFLHHVAAFLVVATLMVGARAAQGEFTLTSARSVLRMDMVYGIAATVLLDRRFRASVLHRERRGLLLRERHVSRQARAVHHRRLLSIYPTIKFMGWRKALREGRLPDFDAGTRRTVRMLIHIELTLIFVIILLAIMMARGVGFLG